MKRHGNLQKCLCFITSDGEVLKKNTTGPKKWLGVLLQVKCIECAPLLHHVPGGTLRKATERNVVTASVTWFIVREEIRAQRQRMHPFIKEMHTRVCLSIHKFCIFFDFKDLSMYDREENTPVSRTNKELLHLLSSAFKTRVCSLVPETAHEKISILAAHNKSIQQNMLKFLRFCLISQGTLHCEGVSLEPTGTSTRTRAVNFERQQLSTSQHHHGHRSREATPSAAVPSAGWLLFSFKAE